LAKLSKKKNEQPARKKESSMAAWALYSLLAILIIAYALLGNELVGLAALLTIIAIFYYEVKYSLKTEGARKSAMDIGVAIGAALLVWLVLILALHTTAPIDAVSSCSMLPVLQRGDIVALGGIGNVTQFAESKRVPVVGVGSGAFQRMESNMSSEFLSFYAYAKGNMSQIAYIFDNSTPHGIGLYNTACLSRYSYLGESKYFSRCYVNMSQGNNLIKYGYSIGNVSVAGVVHSIVYTSSITVGNATIAANYGNPIVVYQTTDKDYFTGSIIHRVFAVLNVSGSYYFLTKGDNNQALDIEFENYPANASAVTGVVLADVPLVGYVKLLLSGQLAVPAGCNQTILK
jgi:hypothetical protein